MKREERIKSIREREKNNERQKIRSRKTKFCEEMLGTERDLIVFVMNSDVKLMWNCVYCVIVDSNYSFL